MGREGEERKGGGGALEEVGVPGWREGTTQQPPFRFVFLFFFSQRFSSSAPLEGRREVKGGEELRGGGLKR